MTDVMVNGNVLVIIPLLALTAKQMANVMNAMQIDGPIDAHNMDDTTHQALGNLSIPCMDVIPYDVSSTMFLFSSLQYIVHNYPFLQAILHCHGGSTLRLISVDKSHLYAIHGHSFRVAMRILRHVLFNVNSAVSVWHPLLLIMTEMMTDSLLASCSTSTNVD